MIKDLIDSNFGSGRFWLTIITGIVFAYATFHKVLTSEAVASIITMVFVSYFQKERTPSSGGNGGANK